MVLAGPVSGVGGCNLPAHSDVLHRAPQVKMFSAPTLPWRSQHMHGDFLIRKGFTLKIVLCVTMPRLILEIAARPSDLQFFRLRRRSRGRGMFGDWDTAPSFSMIGNKVTAPSWQDCISSADINNNFQSKLKRHARTQEVTGWQYPSDAVQQIASILCVLD